MDETTFACFSLALRQHIVAPDGTASMCGIKPATMPKTLSQVEPGHPRLCSSCLLLAIQRDWEVEPLDVAEGRGYEHEGSFECVADDPA